MQIVYALFGYEKESKDYNFDDVSSAREIELYIEDDESEISRVAQAISKNMLRKYKKGIYDHREAQKAWMYLVETGMKTYSKKECRDNNWHQLLSVSDRKELAQKFADEWLEACKSGEFD